MATEILVIDGLTMPSPTSYVVGHMDLDSPDTYRNELGIMQRDRVRQGVRKVELEWTMLTEGEAQSVLSAIQKQEFAVTFLDPEMGVITKQMMVGDRSPMQLKVNDEDEKRWDIKYNLIEM